MHAMRSYNMEQARYWMWTANELSPDHPKLVLGRRLPSPSWEEKAFEADAAEAHSGGCVWPPRSYSCSFCRREFRSAQALGGHMNVHRRDRARLRSSRADAPGEVEAIREHFLLSSAATAANPNPNSGPPRVPTLGEGELGRKRWREEEEDDEIVITDNNNNKRRILTDHIPKNSINFLVSAAAASCSSSDGGDLQKQIEEYVPVEELDLELKLGSIRCPKSRELERQLKFLQPVSSFTDTFQLQCQINNNLKPYTPPLSSNTREEFIHAVQCSATNTHDQDIN